MPPPTPRDRSLGVEGRKRPYGFIDSAYDVTTLPPGSAAGGAEGVPWWRVLEACERRGLEIHGPHM